MVIIWEDLYSVFPYLCHTAKGTGWVDQPEQMTRRRAPLLSGSNQPPCNADWGIGGAQWASPPAFLKHTTSSRYWLVDGKALAFAALYGVVVAE